MVNPFKEVNWNPGATEKRRFAWSLVIGFPCLALIFLLVHRIARGSWTPPPLFWVAAVGTVAGLIFLAVPAITKPFYLGWYFVACCVGAVVSNSILAASYCLFLTPIGLLKRATGRCLIRKTFDKNAKTYWNDAEPPLDAPRYYRQF